MRSQIALALVAAVLSAVVVQHIAAAYEQEKGYGFCSGIHMRYTPPPRGTPPPPLAIKGNRLTNAQSGQSVAIRGINWFGFNVGMGMVDGLWAGGKATATDFALIVYQLRLLGYNAVRLPFRWSDLNSQASSLDKDCAPVSVNQLKQRLISPGMVNQYMGQSLPGNVAPIKNNRAGACNTYIPQTSVWERLIWTMQVFISQGFYVVLDYQPMGSEQQAMKVSTFVEPWTKLWKMVACTSNFQSDLANRVFLDAMNEPDSMQIAWEPSSGRPGARELYLGLADAIWNLTPNKALFFFEGTGQNMFGLNWGNGFITDKNVISSRGLSDANPFFTQLASKPYRGAVVMTPHVYPPSITKSTYLGKDLWDQCRTAFGYLQTKGYCVGGKCNVYPVVIGETGSAFDTSDDKQWLHDFFEFVNSFGDAVQYNPVPLNGWLWWAYNENSGDTGGIVYNSWQDLFWEKINFHIARMGLRPWYMRKVATS